MITFRFSGRTPTPKVYEIGQETDQNAEKLRFLLPQIADGQSAQLLMLLPDKTPEALNIVDGMATVSSAMTEQPGRITAWVEILGGGTIAWNSELIYLDVGDLPPISEEMERKYPTAIQDALDAEARALEAEARANAYYGTVDELAAQLQAVRDAFALIQHMHIDDTAMPEGGTAGQHLVKQSATNYDSAWEPNAITADLGTVTGTGGTVTVTKTVTGVTADMTADRMELGTPGSVLGDVTITTAANAVTFSATVSGSTTVKVKLSHAETVTGT